MVTWDVTSVVQKIGFYVKNCKVHDGDDPAHPGIEIIKGTGKTNNAVFYRRDQTSVQNCTP